MHYFVGIDVSKEKLDIGWLRNPSALNKKTKTVNNTVQGHHQVMRWILKMTKARRAQEVVVTLEPTGIYHEALAYALYESGFQVFIVNPGKARQFASSLNLLHKTDKLDAMLLAYYGFMQREQLALWQPEPAEVRELKLMMRRLDALEKDLQRERNRQQASEFSLPSERVLQSLQGMINALEKEIDKLKRDIDEHIEGYPQLKRNRELLESINGIGPVMSRELVLLFASKTFNSAGQAAAYLGLIPKLNESGTLRGRTTLSKVGNARVRAKLYMAAIVASAHNPDIKAQKVRLLSAGKVKMQALGAAMRKLVQICFGVIKHQREYQPQASTFA